MLSVELQQAIQADETSRNFREGIDSALDITPEPFEEPEGAPAIAGPAAAAETAGDA